MGKDNRTGKEKSKFASLAAKPSTAPAPAPREETPTHRAQRPADRTVPLYVRAAAAVPERQIAMGGVQGADAPLPHAAPIQAAFGTHDIRHVRAAVGGKAAAATKRLGALAYTVGDRVAFGADPDLRLSAHEAAHTVQQRAGVQLQGGVGKPADVHEKHADAVADAVVAGRSAQPLLDAYAHAGPPALGIQLAVATRQTLPDGTDEIDVGVAFRGFPVLIPLHPDADVSDSFDTDPSLLDKLAAAVDRAVNPAGVAVPETSRFIGGPLVRSLIEDELPYWTPTPDTDLYYLGELLEQRAAEFKKQKVRADLEAFLGVDPGTVDWPALLPDLRDAFNAMGNGSLRWRSKLDRAEFVLLVLENEVASAPQVVGGSVPANLSDQVWTFAMQFQFADKASQETFSEKDLGPYVDLIAKLEFVPASFDLAQYKPSNVDLAADERHRILDEWVAANATEATTKIVLDDWTASGLDFQVYLKNLDLDQKKSLILDKLTDAFMLAAKSDAALDRALARMADAQATYEIISRLVDAGHAAEKRNRELVAAIDEPYPKDRPDLDDLVADPQMIYDGEFQLAWATSDVLSKVQRGARVDFAVVENAVTVAGKGNIPATFGLAAFLLTVGTELQALAAMKDTERTHAREDIAERVELSWATIKKIIDDRGKEADRFLDKWIQTLKDVATDWVNANYAEIDKFYWNFDKQAPQVSGRYRLSAWLIDDIANKLESGEITSSTLNGAVVTIKDLKDLRTAAQVLRAKADDFDTPQAREDKKDELFKARGAYQRVKSNIADGTYEPKNYGEDVVVEAKKRLGIGVFENSTLWQQATRQVTVRDNPFQAYVIAMWRVENIIDDAVADLLKGLLRGALTIGSLLVPGVGGLILAAIDIGIGVYSAGKNVGEARRRLDLARLDTQLTIQGVTVKDAEHALNMAWVSFAIELAMAGLFTALVGGLAFKGIQKLRMPLLTKLAETDAALAAKLVERIGDAKLADTLLGHFGDANRLVETLAYVKDGKSLAALVAKVKDTELLSRLLISTGSDTALVELMGKFKNLEKLDTLLGIADAKDLMRVLALTKDEAMVAKLVEGVGSGRAITLLESGLTGEQALRLDRLGEDATGAYLRIAASGDAEALAGANKLIASGSKNTVTASALTETVAFSDKYAGRVSGDFVSRFARVAEQEEVVAKFEAKLAEAKAAGKNPALAEKQLAAAQAELARAKAETNAAADILEGKTVLGEGASVQALPESTVKGVETPEFRVTSGTQPAKLAEVKALGDESGKIGKDAITRNFRKAASQISGHAAGETGGLVRLDAGAGTIPKTNAEIAAEVKGQWLSSIKANPARANDIGWVEVLDRGPAGEARRLLLKLDSTGVTIDAAGTTRP
jgi:hypothetical protein